MTQTAKTIVPEETAGKLQDALEALRESEERFRRFSAAAFEGIAIHEKGVIIDANQAFAAMFGYEPSAVIGMHVLDFAAPESRDLVLENVLSGYEQPYEATGQRKDGSTFAGEVRGKTISYEGRMARNASVPMAVISVRATARRKGAFGSTTSSPIIKGCSGPQVTEQR